MPRGGLEPPCPKTSQAPQACAYTNSATWAKLSLKNKALVGAAGLEPATTGPPALCATNCATPRVFQIKAWPGFEPGYTVLQTVA